MNEIICPHCSKAFKIDASGYAEILKQVRDTEFSQQLHERLELAEKDKLIAVELAKSQVASELQNNAAAKDSEIQALKAKLDAAELKTQVAVTGALSAVEKQRDALANELEQTKRDKNTAVEITEVRLTNDLQQATAKKDAQILALQAKLDAAQMANQIAINEAINPIAKQRDELKSELDRSVLEKQLAETSLKDKYDTQIKAREDEIVRLLDMRARLSTKMVGETLEQHCEIEFNRIRATAFQKSYFEKDNDAKNGSKGDYIFRDMDDSGVIPPTKSTKQK
jgi:hypothetical protein